MNTHLSNATIEMAAAQVRAAKIDANRRALAALLYHHGDRPPERGCSGEALRIRRELARVARPCEAVETTDAEAPVAEDGDTLSRLLARARPAIAAIVAEVAAQHDVPVDLMLAPPRRAPQRSVERRAQLAHREVMYRAYHEACRSYRALGRHFDKDPTAIRRAVRLYVAPTGSGEGAS